MKQGKLLKYAVLGAVLASGFSFPAFAEELDTPTFELDQYVVVANRFPTKITDAHADVSVVTRQDIEEMHMTTVEEALRTVPGTQFLNYGANGANANLSGVRINGSKDVVILVDGVRMTDFQGANNSGYMYASLLSNMDNIERVEILRGAAGTIYGSGAKGGVINIVTRAINSSKTVVDISNGSFGKEAYKINTQARKGKTSYNIYWNKYLIGDTEDGAGIEWDGRTNSKTLGAKFKYDFDKDQSLTVSYDENKTDYSGTDLIYEGPYVGDYEGKNFTLNHNYNMSDQWSHSFTYRKNDVKTNYKKASESYSTRSDYDYEFISEQLRSKTKNHDIIFGIDYSKGNNNLLTPIGYNASGNMVLGNRSMENFSYYIQDDWTILPGLILSGGVRYDDPKADEYAPEMDSHTSKSYKLSYDVTKKDTIYAGRSDFFILPSMEQLYDEEWGNSKLQPATGRTSSIGYNRKFDDNNILTVNWFETESDTIIGYDSSGQYQNYDNAVSRGWNAQFMSQLGRHWSLNLGWSHLFYAANGDNYEMGYYPKDLATFGVNYNISKLNVGFNGFYFMRKLNEKYADMQGWPCDNYGVYNLSVSYAPRDDISFYAKVDNLFDKLYAEHTNVIHQGGQPGQWYSMPGRSIVLGMEYRF